MADSSHVWHDGRDLPDDEICRSSCTTKFKLGAVSCACSPPNFGGCVCNLDSDGAESSCRNTGNIVDARQIYPSSPSEPSRSRSRRTSKVLDDLDSTGTFVRIHVYDLSRLTKRCRLNLLHVGLEVYDKEFYFSIQGILVCPPGSHTAHVHRECRQVGRTSCSDSEVTEIVEKMHLVWPPATYSIVERNCQSFAVAFCEALGLGDCIPPAYCRHAKCNTGWSRLLVASVLQWLVSPRSSVPSLN